jgi:hypothetical protein
MTSNTRQARNRFSTIRGSHRTPTITRDRQGCRIGTGVGGGVVATSGTGVGTAEGADEVSSTNSIISPPIPPKLAPVDSSALT